MDLDQPALAQVVVGDEAVTIQRAKVSTERLAGSQVVIKEAFRNRNWSRCN